MNNHQNNVDFIVCPNKHEILASIFAVTVLVVFTLGTSSQAAARFELIMAKQETENTTVADGT